MPVRTVGEYRERWGYTAKVRAVCQGSGPEEVRHWLEVTYPAIECGPLVRMRRSTGATRPARWPTSTRRGYAREGRPARIEVPDPHSAEPDLDD